MDPRELLFSVVVAVAKVSVMTSSNDVTIGIVLVIIMIIDHCHNARRGYHHAGLGWPSRIARCQ